jgi:hypothetical protein
MKLRYCAQGVSCTRSIHARRTVEMIARIPEASGTFCKILSQNSRNLEDYCDKSVLLEGFRETLPGRGR